MHSFIVYVEKMCVQNAYWGTKLFLLNGTDAISSPEFKDIEDFRKRYLHKIIYLICKVVRLISTY